jgi:hypothetical protein
MHQQSVSNQQLELECDSPLLYTCCLLCSLLLLSLTHMGNHAALCSGAGALFRSMQCIEWQLIRCGCTRAGGAAAASADSSAAAASEPAGKPGVGDPPVQA